MKNKITGTKEHQKRSEFSQYLIETGIDLDDFEPPHWCLIYPGWSSTGGGDCVCNLGTVDRDALFEMIGMLEVVKHAALKALDKIDQAD